MVSWDKIIIPESFRVLVDKIFSKELKNYDERTKAISDRQVK